VQTERVLAVQHLACVMPSRAWKKEKRREGGRGEDFLRRWRRVLLTVVPSPWVRGVQRKMETGQQSGPHPLNTLPAILTK
jgi:hypothetical protein